MNAKPREARDPYITLALVATALVVALILAETLLPNAQRLRFKDPGPDFDPMEQLYAMPAGADWSVRPRADAPAWSWFVFEYRTLLQAALGCSLLFVAWALRSARRLAERERRVRALTDGPARASTDEEVEARDSERRALQRLRLRRTRVLEPLLGGFAFSVSCWLAAALVAGKLDPGWSQAFLVPPMLVAQNLQHYGADFLPAMVRSSWHMTQGIVWGVAAGLLLGFLLSHVAWLQRWTSWHVTIVSALPPILLAEIFKQAVRSPYVPIFAVHGEKPFKLAVVMVTWAVLWPVVTATVHALAHIDDDYRRSLRLLGAESRWEQIRFIELPVVMPPVLANLRIGFVIGLIVLLYAESYGAPQKYPTLGLWFTQITSEFRLPALYALLLFTSAMVLAFEGLRRLVEAWLAGHVRLRERRPSAGVPTSSVAEERRGRLTAFERARDLAGFEGGWAKPAWRFQADDKVARIFRVSKTVRSETIFGGTDDPAFELQVEPGSFVSIIGPSGAGKSTLLKLLLAFEEPDETSTSILRLGGIDLSPRPSAEDLRRLGSLVAYVSQRATLLPHKSVEENLLFGLKRQLKHLQASPDRLASPEAVKLLLAHSRWILGGLDPDSWHWPSESGHGVAAVSSPLGRLIGFMGLDDKMDMLPGQLSGGEAQRVHLLRWLILARPILVMDEAFSALDQPLKGMVRDAIVRHTRALGITVVNVSHDRVDVLQVSDRIWFINKAKVLEKAPPTDLYYRPLTRDLAVFLGHSNIFRVKADEANPFVLRIHEDLYREIQFSPAPGLVGSKPVAGLDGLAFIPSSFVNITHLEPWDRGRHDGDASEWLRVDDVRFTGTHYEVRLTRDGNLASALVLDAVVQDDDLTRLSNGTRLVPGGAWAARIRLHNVIPLPARA